MIDIEKFLAFLFALPSFSAVDILFTLEASVFMC